MIETTRATSAGLRRFPPRSRWSCLRHCLPGWGARAPLSLPSAPSIGRARAGGACYFGGRAFFNHRRLAAAIANDWHALVARYGFALGLGSLALVAVVIRLPSIGADLGHQPIDIDEHRLAANVRLFFVKGEIGHRTVEHYPGILFWALSGGSLLNYLHGVMDGSFATIRSMPVESFVLAGRLVNTLLGALTVVRRRFDGAPDVPEAPPACSPQA